MILYTCYVKKTEPRCFGIALILWKTNSYILLIVSRSSLSILFASQIFCSLAVWVVEYFKISTLKKVYFYQTNSPVKTLDELNIHWSLSIPKFPTGQLREQGLSVWEFKNKILRNSSGMLMGRGLCNTEIPKCKLDRNFGVRIMHSCYVVSARGMTVLCILTTSPHTRPDLKPQTNKIKVKGVFVIYTKLG